MRMLKKTKALFPVILMFFCISISFSACIKDREGGREKPAAESTEETGGSGENSEESRSQSDEEDAKKVKDAMNDMLDEADIALQPEEREAINQMFDMFAK